MLEVVLIVICAVAFSGLLERTGALSPMIRRLIRETDSPVQLTLKTALLSILFLSVSCDQTLAILLPVKSLHKDFERRGLSMAYLVRTISDSGVILAPLQFWNVNTIIIVGLTGMGPGLYAKYSFLIYLFPVVSILYTLLRANKIGHNSKGDQYDTAV
jgi:NhaC family Na+:H+ antiporter